MMMLLWFLSLWKPLLPKTLRLFDVGYEYLYAAQFGTSLNVNNEPQESLDPDTVKGREDDLIFKKYAL